MAPGGAAPSSSASRRTCPIRIAAHGRPCRSITKIGRSRCFSLARSQVNSGKVDSTPAPPKSVRSMAVRLEQRRWGERQRRRQGPTRLRYRRPSRSMHAWIVWLYRLDAAGARGVHPVLFGARTAVVHIRYSPGLSAVVREGRCNDRYARAQRSIRPYRVGGAFWPWRSWRDRVQDVAQFASLHGQPTSMNGDNRNIAGFTQQCHALQDAGQRRAMVRTAVKNDVKTLLRSVKTCGDVVERDNVKIRMGFREHCRELLPAQSHLIDQADLNARGTCCVGRHGGRQACRLDFGRHRHVPPMVSDRKVAVYPQSQNSVKFLINAPPLRHLPRL